MIVQTLMDGRRCRNIGLTTARPIELLRRNSEDLQVVANDAPQLIDQVVRLARTRGDSKAIRYGLQKAAQWATRRGWGRLLVPSKDVDALLARLIDILHLAYLITGSKEALGAAMYIYAGRLALRLGNRSREPSTAISRTYIRAGILLLSGHIEKAQTLLGKTLAKTLPIRPALDTDEAWAAAFRASYLLEEAPRVDGELLSSWGFYRAIETETITREEEQEEGVD